MLLLGVISLPKKHNKGLLSSGSAEQRSNRTFPASASILSERRLFPLRRFVMVQFSLEFSSGCVFVDPLYEMEKLFSEIHPPSPVPPALASAQIQVADRVPPLNVAVIDIPSIPLPVMESLPSVTVYGVPLVEDTDVI